MDKELRLAELLCTRLCHDLTGPIGAVNNGVEFLEEEGFAMRDQAMELIVNSAEEAVSRLQFFRQAYGRVNFQGEASLNEVRELAKGFFKGTRQTLNWPDLYVDSLEVSVSRKLAKVLINMMVLTTKTLPKGGDINVEIGVGDDERLEVRVRAEGEIIRLDEESKDALDHKTPIEDLTPATVQPYFMKRLAKSIDVSISYDLGENHFELIALHD